MGRRDEELDIDMTLYDSIKERRARISYQEYRKLVSGKD